MAHDVNLTGATDTPYVNIYATITSIPKRVGNVG